MNTTVQQQSEEARGKFIHQHVTLERNYALNVSPDSLTQKDRVIAEIRTCLSSSQNPKETLITENGNETAVKLSIASPYSPQYPLIPDSNPVSKNNRDQAQKNSGLPHHVHIMCCCCFSSPPPPPTRCPVSVMPMPASTPCPVSLHVSQNASAPTPKELFRHVLLEIRSNNARVPHIHQPPYLREKVAIGSTNRGT